MSVVFFPSVNHLAFSFGCLHLNPSPFIVWFYGLIIDGIYKYEVRWHTRTPGAPKDQGNTWVIQRTKPGNGGQKPSTQFLIGDNEWVEGWKWYDAIKARKEGTATKEQIEILDRGHWKE